MWGPKTVFIFVLFLLPFAVHAAEPTDFRCVCDYKQADLITAECTESKNIIVNLGEKWKIEKEKMTYFGSGDAKTEVEKVSTGTFSQKEKCTDLLEPAFDQDVICGSYVCTLEANVPYETIAPNGNIIIKYKWESWASQSLQWSSINTKDNPVPIIEGKVGTAEVAATGSTNLPITVTCLDCDDYGAIVDGNGSKIKIVWDTSKVDVFTKMYAIKVKAQIGDDEAGALFGDVYFSVTGVSPVQTKEDVDAWIKSQYGKPKDYAGALPDCAFSGTCRSVNDLLQLIINFASGMFLILGSFAFAFFVYGGFKMIISMGNAEMVETGKKTMIAAALGLVVAMVAYTAIDLMLDILNVDDTFRGIK